MADSSPSSNTGDDTGVRTDAGTTTDTPPGMPLWVKVIGIVVLVLVLLFAIMGFASGGIHGPGRHMPSGGAGGYPSPIARWVQPL